jgi:hypothetical protein
LKEPAQHIFEPETREEFEEWVENNPTGYYINRITENHVMFHCAECSHIWPNVGELDLVKNPKFCSKNYRLLGAWWAGKGEQEPVPCQTCKPPSLERYFS